MTKQHPAPPGFSVWTSVTNLNLDDKCQELHSYRVYQLDVDGKATELTKDITAFYSSELSAVRAAQDLLFSHINLQALAL